MYQTGALFTLENRIHQLANSGQDVIWYFLEATGYANSWISTIDSTQPSGTGMAPFQSGRLNRALQQKTIQVSGVSYGPNTGKYLV